MRNRLIYASILCAAISTLAARTARAEDEFVLNNDAGGEIVLTYEQSNCEKDTHLVYATNAAGDILGGCWATVDSKYIIVHWRDGAFKRYAINSFTYRK